MVVCNERPSENQILKSSRVGAVVLYRDANDDDVEDNDDDADNAVVPSSFLDIASSFITVWWSAKIKVCPRRSRDVCQAQGFFLGHRMTRKRRRSSEK